MTLPLPQVTTPTYDVTIPSSGKTIKIRPFLVKEEKLLLMATQSKDTNEIISTVRQVINNCLVDSDVTVDNLAFFDIDYLFIALRAKSIGETVELQFTCNATNEEGNRCGQIFPVEVDISKAHVVKDKELEDKVWITDTIGVKFKYPKYSVMRSLADVQDPYEQKSRMIYACIDFIFDKDNVYSVKDYTKEDFEKFFDSLTVAQLEKLEEWVDNLPTFAVDLEKKCDKCGFNHKIRYDDFASFFL